MTYKKIIALGKKEIGITIQSCWIADVKRELGLPVRIAPNRINQNYIQTSCPEGETKEWIKNILRNS